MLALTAAERRAAVVVVGLLAIGSIYDGCRARDRVGLSSDGRGAMGRGTGAADSLAGAMPGPVARDSGASMRSAPARIAEGAFDPEEAVPLNRATVEELDALPGVGPVLARRIVEHRHRHGPFRRPEDLLAVPGIGPRLLERLRPRISL